MQVVNFVFFFLETIYLVLPSFWIMFFLVLYEGLLGGGVYANAFYSISKQVRQQLLLILVEYQVSPSM